jgi:acyl-CoA thioesterase-1
MSLARLLLVLVVAIGLASCDGREPIEPASSEDLRGESGVSERDSEPGASGSTAEGDDRSALPKIIAFGDSLTAGFGIARDEAYPAQLQRMLDEAGFELEVINAGVSGETTAGGRRRLAWVLEDRDVRAIVLSLGGNDGLRGLSPSEMKQNLKAMIDEARLRDITVLLCGMIAPPNHGETYTGAFRDAFFELAEEEDVAFLPFLLEGVVGDPGLNQSDGIHPNPEGAAIVAGNVFEALTPLLEPANANRNAIETESPSP